MKAVSKRGLAPDKNTILMQRIGEAAFGDLDLLQLWVVGLQKASAAPGDSDAAGNQVSIGRTNVAIVLYARDLPGLLETVEGALESGLFGGREPERAKQFADIEGNILFQL